MTRPLLVLLASAALVAFGCGDSSSASDDLPTPDAGADAGADVGGDDAGETDAGGDSATPPTFDAAPAQALAEWQPLEAEWRLGVTDPNRGDGLQGDIEAGNFSFPPEGGGAYGIQWSTPTFFDDGRTEQGGGATLYVAARFSVDETTGVLVQADVGYRVWLNGLAQPADIYGSGANRVAFTAAPGEHVLVMQAEGRRGNPRINVWTTPDEGTLHTRDLTFFEWVGGSTDPQWLGVSFSAFGDLPTGPLRARVVENEWVEETTVLFPGVAANSTTQLPFEIVPKQAPEAAGEGDDPVTVPITVRIEAAGWDASYDLDVEIPVVAPGTTYRRTFRSGVDGSAQYYGVVPPSDFDPARDYGMILSLHGASVQGIGQARAYSQKDWAYLVAPTNRRPFGFDWEVYGRLDGLEVLADAKEHFGHDPTRVHVTGHSMGGHGTWQFGTLFPTLFATVGPSAGWASFYSYTGETRPQGVLARSAASSDSHAFQQNLERRAVFIVHGDADDNVPVREARDWRTRLEPFVTDFQYHEQPGAGHWWDGELAGGADCVDWPDMIDTMEDRRLDPYETDFDFLTPSPWVSPRHSYATIEAVETAMANAQLSSRRTDDAVALTTTNVLRLAIETQPLLDAGVSALSVDGEEVALDGSVQVVGTESAKTTGFSGPLNQAFERPYCFVYEAAGPAEYAQLAAYMTSYWAVYGNGFACTVTWEDLDEWTRENYQLAYLGIPPEWIEWDVPEGEAVPFALDENGVGIGSVRERAGALWAVYPENGKVAALLLADRGGEGSLFDINPYQSRLVLPDYTLLGSGGLTAAGFFDADWRLDPGMANGLP